VALRGEAAGQGSHIQLAKEVMHIARKHAGTSQSFDTRSRSAHLPAGAIPRPAAMNRRINEQLPRP
jgi:hypothetical protein